MLAAAPAFSPSAVERRPAGLGMVSDPSCATPPAPPPTGGCMCEYIGKIFCEVFVKYSAQQEQELMTEIWSPAIANNPLAFVRFVYPWNQEGTPLEGQKGPRKWQAEILESIGTHIARNERLDMPEMFRQAVASGRGIGKSALVAWLVHWMLSTRLGGTTIVTANTEQQLRSRTWPEIGKWLTLSINGHWFDRTATAIKPAPWFQSALERDLNIDCGYYYAQSQLWSEENPDAFAGIHSTAGVQLIMDEASGIPDAIYTVSEGFFTEPTKNRFWFSFSNPRRNSGPFFESFHSAAAFWNTRQIDSRDVEGTDKAVFENMIEQYGVDSATVRVEVMGQFPRTDDATVISPELVRSAMNRDVALAASEPIVWGLDVARQGSDKSALAKRQGNTVLEVKTFGDMDLMELCGAIQVEYDACSAMSRPDEVCIDVIGLGAGVYDRLRELGEVPVVGVNVAEAASVKGTYLNLRAELWFAIRDWLMRRDCRLPQDEQLYAELIAPQYDFNSAGKIRLESKEKMRRRGVKSPDRADALALTFASAGAVFSGTGAGGWSGKVESKVPRWI